MKNWLYFFLLPCLSSYYKKVVTCLEQVYKNKELLFSGKGSCEEASVFIKNQMLSNSLIIRIKDNPEIRIIDTVNGGVYYHGNQLMFILIPRSISIDIPNPRMFMNSLNDIQSQKSRLSSNRGKINRVLFEIQNSNYVDLGISVSRFLPVPYKKIVHGASEISLKAVETYVNSVEEICRK